jgi:hypothetical protein
MNQTVFNNGCFHAHGGYSVADRQDTKGKHTIVILHLSCAGQSSEHQDDPQSVMAHILI